MILRSRFTVDGIGRLCSIKSAEIDPYFVDRYAHSKPASFFSDGHALISSLVIGPELSIHGILTSRANPEIRLLIVKSVAVSVVKNMGVGKIAKYKVMKKQGFASVLAPDRSFDIGRTIFGYGMPFQGGDPVKILGINKDIKSTKFDCHSFPFPSNEVGRKERGFLLPRACKPADMVRISQKRRFKTTGGT